MLLEKIPKSLKSEKGMLSMTTEYYDLYEWHGQRLALVKPRSMPLGSQPERTLPKIPVVGKA